MAKKKTAPHHDIPPPLNEADLLYQAWALIANAHGPSWEGASDEWRMAAANWREKYHEFLLAGGLPSPEDS